MSEEKKKWYQDPDGVTKIVALVLLLLLLLCLHLFAGDFIHKACRLAVSGNVKALAEYLRSFGPWAIASAFSLMCSSMREAFFLPSFCLPLTA